MALLNYIYYNMLTSLFLLVSEQLLYGRQRGALTLVQEDVEGVEVEAGVGQEQGILGVSNMRMTMTCFLNMVNC